MSPYYIIAPRYARTSAGVRVLFRLADLLNKEGASAYVFLWPYFNHDLATSPMDIAPFLSKRAVDYHFQNGLTPIVVYPETVRVSRFDPPVRVRYVMNYNNLLYENESLEKDDYILAYSEAISREISSEKPRQTLFITVSDPVFFAPPKTPVQRQGGVFYAGKFKYHFGGKTFPLTEGMPEITRDRPDSQTPEQIRALFQQAEYFYCYEDSALALEAILCGCPTVFLPNEHFPAPLGAKELNGLGFAWGTSPEQLQHAKDTVVAAREWYLTSRENVKESVRSFMAETQRIAASTPYTVPFAQDYIKAPSVFAKAIATMRFLMDVVHDRGWGGTLRTIAKRILSGRLKI